jgi:hypothetical protein
MCKTWNRIHMRIGIVLMPFQIRHQHGNSDRDPDRHQYDADPQHWE